MRALIPITLWMLAMACTYGQMQEETINSRLKLQMENYRNGKSSELNGKKFEGSGTSNLKKAAPDNMSAYLGSKKFGGSDSFTTRSFFGLKNPWFGKKVFTSDAASLWSKSIVANADKKYGVSAASEKPYKDSKKSMPKSTSVVEEKPFIARGSAQGALDQAKANKDLSIEDVRSILNKNQ